MSTKSIGLIGHLGQPTRIGESGICHMAADFEARLLGRRAVQLEPLGES